ncbi:MAG TPA: alpha/beta hydrolase [Streptosporangiaceae bacterium]|nr:alpha/beta hydrolase [Streptosporangiaceae bacterium]
MGLVMDYGGTVEGYEAVSLPLEGEAAGARPAGGAVLRRRSARPSRRAVMYVHCVGDSFVTDDLVSWYTERRFHFYAADLRKVGAEERPPGDGAGPAADLAECFRCLDAAIVHLRESDGIDTVVVSAHGSGALIAALWCHARRGSQPVDALVLAAPRFGVGSAWLRRSRVASTGPAARRPPLPLLAAVQHRVRRGLKIACPVLVMCPAKGWDSPGGTGGLLLVARLATGGRVTTRLGEHVTWLKLGSGLPAGPVPDGSDRKRFFDELGRWLGAYLTGQVRDQLL